MAKQINARLIVDRVTIPCNEAIFSMIVPTGPDGKPDHLNRSILVDVYINPEEQTVEPVMGKVKELHNHLVVVAGGKAKGVGPELDVQLDFDDDFNTDAVLASIKFKGRVVKHDLFMREHNPGFPDTYNYHIQIAPLQRERVIMTN
jgi:hypothetical protein